MSDLYSFLRLIVLSSFLFLIDFQGFCTHIVGGGFDMKYYGGYQYRFRLTLYFDDINGSSGALDQTANFSFYRKVDNKLIENIAVDKEVNEDTINYSASACANVSSVIKTRVLLYELEIFLSPGLYNHTDGYYVVWERCCRNDQIFNVTDPGSVGQTFFMDFPPVTRNGQPFENDSPLFKPVPNNLFCINQLSYIDFNATDFDGDSLVFELVDPLDSKKAISGSPRVDTSSAKPYFSVPWKSGFNINRQIPGNPSLTINRKTGLLSVKPNAIGLFVFAVACYEYRNGKKIGEVRREFQQLVVDCPTNNPPVITIPDPVRPRRLAENDTIFITNNTQNKTCVNVKATDFDANQTVKLRAFPLNFVPISPITGDTLKVIASSSDTARLNFCLPACVGSTKNNPFHLRVMVLDNGCAGSLADTLNIFIVLTVPPILIPSVSLSPPDSSFVIGFEDSLKILVNSVVPVNQSNQLQGKLFNNRQVEQSFTSQAMSFLSKVGNGPQSSLLRWKAPCSIPAGMPFRIDFKVNTLFCNQNIELKKSVQVRINPLSNRPSIMAEGLDSSVNLLEWSTSLGKSLQEVLIGKIPGLKSVRLFSNSNSAELAQYGISFLEKSGAGRVEQNLNWNTTCDQANLSYPKTFTFLASSSTCGQNKFDTLNVKLDFNNNELKKVEPINLITNNLDGKNDLFSLKALGLEQGCGFKFEGIEIFDRWGEKHFETLNPDFEWPKSQAKTGTYFYFLKVNGEKFTSWIQVVK